MVICLATLALLLGPGTAKADPFDPTTATSLTIAPSLVSVDSPVTLTAVVTGGTGGQPPGLVEFDAATGGSGPTAIGTAPLEPVPGSTTSWKATLVTSSLRAATYTVTATYKSDDFFNFFSSTSPEALLTVSSVAIHNTATTLTADPATVVTGHSETLTATVTQLDGAGIPTGVVTFRDNDVYLGTASLNDAGVAKLSVGGFIAGPHLINADYSGDIVDYSSGASLVLNVTGLPAAVDTTITAHATPNPMTAGEAVVLSAHVVQFGTQTPPPAAALVTFTRNGVYLGEAPLDANGDASVTVGGWIPGTYTIEASYTGDILDLPSSADFSLRILSPDATDVRTTMTGTEAALGGGAAAYAVTVTNAGPGPAANVSLTDVVPAELTAPSVTTTAGSCAISAGVLTCQLGTLASGAAVTVTLAGTIPATTTATSVSNTASASSSTEDPTSANNTATFVSRVIPLADLSVTSVGAPASVFPGSPLTYVIRVTNLGPGAGRAVLTDMLPVDATFASASAGCAATGPNVSCDLGVLAAGASATVTINATLSDTSNVTSVTNSFSVAALDSNDGNLANNAATTTASVLQIGCPVVGHVHGNQEFKQVVAGKTRTLHLETDGDCDLDKKTGKIYLHHAKLRVQIDGQPVLIDAKQDSKHSDIARVAISGPSDATISGTWGGVPFTVTLHDGGAGNKNDSVRVQYGSVDTSTLTAKHGEVHIVDH